MYGLAARLDNCRGAYAGAGAGFRCTSKSTSPEASTGTEAATSISLWAMRNRRWLVAGLVIPS